VKSFQWIKRKSVRKVKALGKEGVYKATAWFLLGSAQQEG